MKILVGLDALWEKTSPVQSLLARLDLQGARETLLHVVPPVASSVWHVHPLLGDEEAEKQERIEVARAARLLTGIDPDVRHKVVVGQPAGTILAEADLLGADLIAANASQRGALESLFTGSVARALATGASQSVLLARPTEETGTVRAVFATDHSEYAEKCVEALIRLAPRGIEHLTILTAYPEHDDESVAARPCVEERCYALIQRLDGQIGTPETTYEYRIVPGKPREVVEQIMAETGAELLILGAKGHSLAARLALGSVSFEQAIGAHPYSVLILRAASD